MNRRSFIAALLALPFVPVAAKEAKARINVAWAAMEVPHGGIAHYGVVAAETPATVMFIDVPAPYYYREGALYVEEAKLYDPRKETVNEFISRHSQSGG
ncbi:hypothetical protein [Rhizobium sp. X9]|uniref:hypothetical protein n=1 Tax=Rhizobium sp. X9 TaxID=2815360 RepID=UPI001C0D489B|nr:hypothetical protein [Rhizobium sp. X9]